MGKDPAQQRVADQPKMKNWIRERGSEREIERETEREALTLTFVFVKATDPYKTKGVGVGSRKTSLPIYYGMFDYTGKKSNRARRQNKYVHVRLVTFTNKLLRCKRVHTLDTMAESENTHTATQSCKAERI